MMRPLLLCLLFLCLTAPPASAQDDPAQANLVHARQAYDSGSWEKALGLYADIYASPQSTPTQKAEAALEWSSILWEQGDYTTARARAEEALTLAKKERLDAAAGRLLLTIGHIEAAQGQFSRANSTLKACVTLAGELDDPVFGALCKMNLSLIAKIQGKQGMSDAQLRAAIKNLERAGTPLATGSALAKTGELLAKNGDHTQAMLLLERAQGVFEAAGSVPAAARNRLRIARQLQDQGQFDRAKVHINLALPKLQAMGNRPLLVTTYGLQGKDAERLGDLAGARGSYAKSLSLANAIGSPQLRAQSHLALCELGTKGPHLADLEHHCTQAATTFASLRVPDLQARALIVLGQVYQSHAQYQAAQTTYKQAITLLESTDPKANALSIATQRANLCQVEHAMNVTGTLLTCKKALAALTAQPAQDALLPHLAATAYVTGFAAQKEKRVKESLAHFTQAHTFAMAANPPDRERAVDAQLRIGIIYAAALKGGPQALAAFDQGLALIKGHESQGQLLTRGVQLHEQRLQHLIDSAQWPQATAAAHDTLAFAATHTLPALAGWTHNMLAQAHLKQGDRALAMASLSKGVDALADVPEQKELRTMMQENLKKLSK